MMCTKTQTIVTVMLGVTLLCTSHGALAQVPDYPWPLAAHSQGNIQLTVDEIGGFGDLAMRYGGEWFPFPDPITNDSIYGCVYPRGTRNMFITGRLRVAAVKGSDTVSSYVPAWSGDAGNYNSIWTIGTLNNSQPHYSPDAHSELDLECVYYDTVSFQDSIIWGWYPYESGWHEAPGLVVTQRSMAWSGALIDDFVLFHYEMTNMGHKPLENVYVCLWCNNIWGTGDEHLTGFLRESPVPDQCGNIDDINIAYSMDDDGDPVSGAFGPHSRRGAVGVTLLGSSAESVQIGYNWFLWDAARSQDWGPRRRPSLDEPFRSFNPFFAFPANELTLYHMLSRPSIAYDQLFAAVDHTGEGWMQPWPYADLIAGGWRSTMYYYFGPFDIPVRDKVSFTIAVVGGDNVHNDPLAHFDPNHPQEFYDQLDFSELATNARWAQWVYDNPGYDTDSDGYCGEFRICEGDTIWYKGDGVPDFRGNTPPPAPFTRILTEPSKITIRWNGFLCETTKDPFSNLVDFEGYRVYCGLDTRRASLSILSSYDRENFFRLKWHDLGSGYGKWLNDEPPYSLEELQTIHDNPNFDPHRYTRDYPLFEGDSVFYFQMVDANLDDLSSPLGIHKVYPNATDPGTDSTLWTEDDITHDYSRPLPKYYEYEYVLNNLMPTVPYFISVTSFDFGYAGGRGNLPPDESNPLNNLTECYAQTSADTVEAYDLDVYVYPNPYRVDADYHERGYENRAGRIIPDRARLLHFGNLPNVCMISIFSLDGDLIGKKDHNFPEGGPEAMHDWWNLVSRSGLAVESGLYYWVVESATRSQIGKFVIIK
ncbi:MAG: hypothetical protein J7J98_04725 [candidate division Zixibacteria bacterium]|nr:hypothetical protein [candidate division Zixibacteria bacterium]